MNWDDIIFLTLLLSDKNFTKIDNMIPSYPEKTYFSLEKSEYKTESRKEVTLIKCYSHSIYYGSLYFFGIYYEKISGWITISTTRSPNIEIPINDFDLLEFTLSNGKPSKILTGPILELSGIINDLG